MKTHVKLPGGWPSYSVVLGIRLPSLDPRIDVGVVLLMEISVKTGVPEQAVAWVR